MKKQLLILWSMTLLCGTLSAQSPLKEQITLSVELAKAYPLNGAEAWKKCGESCKPEENILKPFSEKKEQWKKHFENTKPSDVDINSYSKPSMKGTPGQDEINLLQNYSNYTMENQQLLIDYSNKSGEIKRKYDDKWVVEIENFRKELSKCPSKHEGAAGDPACVNPIKARYETILNQIIDDFIKELGTHLSDYKSKIKANNAELEGTLAKLDYGDKAAMPNIKQIVVGMQGMLMSLVVGYGETVADLWASSCSRYNEIQKMKENIY